MLIDGPIGFLGYGNMASAIAEGLIEQGIVRSTDILAYDPVEARVDAARMRGIEAVDSTRALAQRTKVLVLAVKPQQMAEALAVLKPGFQTETLIISIAAGISTAFVRRHLGDATRVIRVMPNTPALVEAGAAGIAAGEGCTEADLALAQALFSAVGIAEVVRESDIDAVTALSGSGPAYFFYAVECLVEAAVAEGLNHDVATRLAAQTLYGAGQLLKDSGEPAAELRRKVTSPGGTTEAAIKTFQSEGLGRVFAAGVAAAAARSRELGA